MIYCPECEHECAADAATCPRCGHRLAAKTIWSASRAKWVALASIAVAVLAIEVIRLNVSWSDRPIAPPATTASYPESAHPRGFVWDQLNDDAREWCELFSDREIARWITRSARWKANGVPKDVAYARSGWGVSVASEVRDRMDCLNCFKELNNGVWTGAIDNLEDIAIEFADPTRPREKFIDELRAETCWLNTNTLLFNMLTHISHMGDRGESRSHALSWASSQLETVFGDSFDDMEQYGDDYIDRCADLLVREAYVNEDADSGDQAIAGGIDGEVTTTSPSGPQTHARGGWNLVSVDAKVIQSDDAFEIWSWKVVIANDGPLVTLDGKVRFFDADGFEVHSASFWDLDVHKGETATATETTLMQRATSDRVESFRAEVGES